MTIKVRTNMKLVRLERRVVDAEAKFQLNPTHHRGKILKQRRRLLQRARVNGEFNARVNEARMTHAGLKAKAS